MSHHTSNEVDRRIQTGWPPLPSTEDRFEFTRRTRKTICRQRRMIALLCILAGLLTGVSMAEFWMLWRVGGI